jgi:hypothetical protein
MAAGIRGGRRTSATELAAAMVGLAAVLLIVPIAFGPALGRLSLAGFGLDVLAAGLVAPLLVLLLLFRFVATQDRIDEREGGGEG